MRRRVAAAVLLAAALGLHLGVAVPARRQRDDARDEFARGREERERLRAQAARLDRRAAAGRAPAGDAAAARALRLSLVRATEGLSLGAVSIGAEAGRGGVAARGRLVAEGRQADVLRAAGRLADPSSGVLLERVALVEIPGGEVRIEVEAFSTRGAWCWGAARPGGRPRPAPAARGRRRGPRRPSPRLAWSIRRGSATSSASPTPRFPRCMEGRLARGSKRQAWRRQRPRGRASSVS